MEGSVILELGVLSGYWEECERERVLILMLVYWSLNRNKDIGKSFVDELCECKYRKRIKKKKVWSEFREFDEGFDEGSEMW